MPLAVDKLTKESSDREIQEAISASYETCVNEGKPPKECGGMIYGIAREKTGKPLARTQ